MDWYDPDKGIEHREEIIDSSLEGPLADAIAYLQSFLGPDRENLRIEQESDYEGGYYLMLKWERRLSPEEKAKREREDREASAKAASEREAAERRQYEVLRAKYE